MTRHLFSHAVTVASALAGLAVGEFRRRVLLAQLRAARQAAVTDPLTGLVNRAGMAAHVGTALRAGPAGLLLIDLDSFKAVNDTHGHAAGDVVLVAVATRLRSALLPGEWAARHGGDEFSVLLTATSEPWVRRRAEVVAGAVAGPVALPDGAVVRVAASVGYALASDAPVLWERADDAMYRDKNRRHGQEVAA